MSFKLVIYFMMIRMDILVLIKNNFDNI